MVDQDRRMGKAESAQNGAKEVRILFLNTAESFGPIMQVHTGLMKHLDPSVYRVVVATNSRGNSGEKLRQIEGILVKTYSLGETLRGQRSLWRTAYHLLRSSSTVLSLIRILWLVRRHRIDLIHAASGPRMILLGTTLSLLSRAKLIIHVHEEIKRRDLLRTFLLNTGLSRADAIITVSQAIKQAAVEFGIEPAKIWPILNVVDLKRFHPNIDGSAIRWEYGIEPQTPVILTVGRIQPSKGQRELLEALVAVKEVFPSVKALLVGWDAQTKMPGGRTYQQELQDFCTRQGLADNVIFAGPRADIPKVFATADVVVIPSKNDDPCPLVVLEAMASGKPVIGTISGGIPEELESSGILVPRANPQELAAAIIRLLEQPMLREQLGKAARKRAEEHFYESRLAEETAKVYTSVLNRHRLYRSASPYNTLREVEGSGEVKYDSISE